MPPRPRLEDVAARAGVSTASASLVLRGLPGPAAATREAVLLAASELSYRPDRTASLLARRRTRLLGVTMDVSNAFHAELLEDLQAAADSQGYDVVVSPMTRTRDERRAVELLLDFRCEAVLLMGPTLSDDALASLAEDQPLVAIGRPSARRLVGVDVVRAADDEGVSQAVAHLVGLGHRRIAFLDGPAGPIATRRRQGYRAAVRRLVGAAASHIVPAGGTEETGADAAGLLLPVGPGSADPTTRPTALVAFNDRAALGALDRLRRNGIGVPGEVSVVGFDDSPIARLATVDLTTVSQDPLALAEAAVRAAAERLDGRRTPTEVVLAPRLVVRSTTGPASAT